MSERESRPPVVSPADGASPAPSRRTFHPADPPPGIPIAVWRSLDAAAAQACGAPARADLVSREREAADALLEGIHRALSDRPLCAAARSQLPDMRALRMTRRVFLASAPRSDLAETAAVLRVLNAFERLECTLEGNEVAASTQLSGAEALDLAVSTAHDMRSPLGAILFLADMLRRASAAEPETVRRQAGLIYNASLGLSLLASDIIDFGRGSSDLASGPPAAFSVAEAVQSVCDIVLPIAEEKQLELRVSCTGPAARVGYPAALSRVLLNLVTNALKFTERGWVEISTREVGAGRVEFAVSDTGPGLPAGRRDALFEPVRRVSDSGEYAISSSGLGLVICRRLLSALRSELRVETAEGQGTRFSFVLDLPLARSV